MSSNLNISGGYENLQATTPFITSFSLAYKLIHSSLYPHFFCYSKGYRVQGTSSKQNYKEKGKLKGVKKKNHSHLQRSRP